MPPSPPQPARSPRHRGVRAPRRAGRETHAPLPAAQDHAPAPSARAARSRPLGDQQRDGAAQVALRLHHPQPRRARHALDVLVPGAAQGEGPRQRPLCPAASRPRSQITQPRPQITRPRRAPDHGRSATSSVMVPPRWSGPAAWRAMGEVGWGGGWGGVIWWRVWGGAGGAALISSFGLPQAPCAHPLRFSNSVGKASTRAARVAERGPPGQRPAQAAAARNCYGRAPAALHTRAARPHPQS